MARYSTPFGVLARATLRRPDLSGNAKCVLMAIGEWSRNGSPCRPTDAEIAESAGIGEATARRCLASLRDLGFIRIEGGGARGRTILPDWMTDPERHPIARAKPDQNDRRPDQSDRANPIKMTGNPINLIAEPDQNGAEPDQNDRAYNDRTRTLEPANPRTPAYAREARPATTPKAPGPKAAPEAEPAPEPSPEALRVDKAAAGSARFGVAAHRLRKAGELADAFGAEYAEAAVREVVGLIDAGKLVRDAWALARLKAADFRDGKPMPEPPRPDPLRILEAMPPRPDEDERREHYRRMAEKRERQSARSRAARSAALDAGIWTPADPWPGTDAMIPQLEALGVDVEGFRCLQTA